MNKFAKRSIVLKSAAALAAALFAAANVTYASSMSDERSLQRGAVEDATPQQKYHTAIREAGGAYKEALRGCVQAADERQTCVREAKATYDRDMADAKLILRGREPMQARLRG